MESITREINNVLRQTHPIRNSSTIEYVKKSPILKHLLKLQNIKHWEFWIAVIYLVATSIAQIIMAEAIDGCTSSPNCVTIRNDFMSFAANQMFYSIAVFHFLVFPRHWIYGFGNSFNNIDFDSEQGATREDTYESILLSEEVINRLKRVPTRLSILVLVLWILWTQFNPDEKIIWAEQNLTTLVAVTIMWGIGWFSMAGAFVQIFVLTECLPKAIKVSNLKVLSLIPDNSGGISGLIISFSKYAFPLLTYTLVLAAWGIEYLIRSPQQSMQLLFIPVYMLALIPAILWMFHSFVMAMHTKMTHYRDSLTTNTATYYSKRLLTTSKTFTPLGNSIFEYDINALNEKITLLNTLKELHTHQMSVPVWPTFFRPRLTRIMSTVLVILSITLSVAKLVEALASLL